MTGPNISSTTPQVEVKLVSGKTLKVLGQLESEWFNETREAYKQQTRFTETTDLRDLDRVLILELMIFRWTQQLAAGTDYEGWEVDPEQLRKNIKEYSDQLTKVKDSMGLTKKVRDDVAADGNFAAWLSDLKARAKIFGVHRETQLTKALVLMNDLFTLVSSYDRADKEERVKLGIESEHDILEWIRTVMQPEYEVLDAYFREHQQRYWIQNM